MTNANPPATGTGDVLVVSVPSPIAPSCPCPQQNALPIAVRPHVWPDGDRQRVLLGTGATRCDRRRDRYDEDISGARGWWVGVRHDRRWAHPHVRDRLGRRRLLLGVCARRRARESSRRQSSACGGRWRPDVHARYGRFWLLLCVNWLWRGLLLGFRYARTTR